MTNKKTISASPSAFSIENLNHAIGNLKRAIYQTLDGINPRTRRDLLLDSLVNPINVILKQYNCPPCQISSIEHAPQSRLTLATAELLIDSKPIGKGANGDVYSVVSIGDPDKRFALKTRPIPMSLLAQPILSTTRSRLYSDEDGSDSSKAPSPSSSIRYEHQHSPTISESSKVHHLHVDREFSRVSYHKTPPKSAPPRKTLLTRTADAVGNGVFEYILSSQAPFSGSLLSPYLLTLLDDSPCPDTKGVVSLGLLTPLANGGSLDHHQQGHLFKEAQLSRVPLPIPEGDDFQEAQPDVQDPLAQAILEKIGTYDPLTPTQDVARYKESSQWASIFRKNLHYLVIQAIKGLYQKGISFRDLKLENIVFTTTYDEEGKPQFGIKLIDCEACDHLDEVSKFGGSFMTVPPEVAPDLLVRQTKPRQLKRVLSRSTRDNLQGDLDDAQRVKVTGKSVGTFALGAVLFHLHLGHSLHFDKDEDPSKNPKWQASYAKHVHRRLSGQQEAVIEEVPDYITALTHTDPEVRVKWFEEFVLQDSESESLDELEAAHDAMQEIPLEIAHALASIFVVHTPPSPTPQKE